MEFPITLCVKKSQPVQFIHREDAERYLNDNKGTPIYEVLTSKEDKRPYFQKTVTLGHEPTPVEINEFMKEPTDALIKFIQARYAPGCTHVPARNGSEEVGGDGLRHPIIVKSFYSEYINKQKDTEKMPTYTFVTRYVLMNVVCEDYTKLKKHCPTGFDTDVYGTRQHLRVLRPVEEGIEFLSRFVQRQTDSLLWTLSTGKTTDDDVITDRDAFNAVMADHPNMIKKYKGKLMGFNKESGLWDTEAENTFSILAGLVFANDPWGSNKKNVKNAFYFANELKSEITFFDEATNNTLGKIAYQDAIWDIENHKRIEFAPEYFFTFKIDRPIPTVRNEAVIAKLQRLVFDDPHPVLAVRREVMKQFGIAQTGRNPDRRVNIHQGKTGTCKSTIVKLITTSHGEFATNPEAQNFAVCKKGNNDHCDWLLEFAKARFCCTVECPKNIVLDGELLKRISGGDLLKARPIHGKPIAFYSQVTPFIFGNEIAPIDPVDEAMRDRIKGVQYLKQFLRGTGRDTSVIEWVQTREAHEAFFWILEDAYDMWKTEGFLPVKEIEEFSKQFVDEQDEFINIFKAEFEFSENKKDVVPTRDVYPQFISFSRKESTITDKMMDTYGISKARVTVSGAQAMCFVGMKRVSKFSK